MLSEFRSLLRILAKHRDKLEVQTEDGVLKQEILEILSIINWLHNARKINGSLCVFLPLKNGEEESE